MQKLLNGYKNVGLALREVASQRYLLVCDSSFLHLAIKDYINELGIPYVCFDQFASNPLYEDVCKGVKLFNKEQCDAIVAIGGGSTIDVAKCIKLYCRMNHDQNYLQQDPFDSGISLIAVPTTAGTGSESTRYSVIYYEGKKQSVTYQGLIPNYAILEPSLLKTLPLYQKKCTMMDALCQGIESWWSVNSTDESKNYSKKVLELIMANWRQYIFDNDADAAFNIMFAANYGGRAINIAQTTAAHAMSYKITSLYNLPHGHAVAVCLPAIWDYMLGHIDDCVDVRGGNYVEEVFDNIAFSMGANCAKKAIEMIRDMMLEMELGAPVFDNDAATEIETLCNSVNPIRLKNNPILLDHDAIRLLYNKVFLRETLND